MIERFSVGRKDAAPRETAKRPPLEHVIQEKVVFKAIDIHRPENKYHQDMLKGLLDAETDEVSLIRRVLKEKGLDHQTPERVVVESIVAEDISQGVGTKRNVDRFSFMFADGTEVIFTVSLDIEPFAKAADSPSLAEGRALDPTKRTLLTEGYSAVQQMYGSTVVRCEDGKRGLICKEYLPGKMLSEVLTEIRSQTGSEEDLAILATEVGRCLARAMIELGGMPVDTHGANIIIQAIGERQFTARICDVEYTRSDHQGVMQEKNRVRQLLEPFPQSVEDGFRETLRRMQAPQFAMYT